MKKDNTLTTRRYEALTKCIAWRKHDLAERLAATKTLFKTNIYAVEIHSHSDFSDGTGTVRENYDAAMNAGLDFLFATDHLSLGQKRHVAKLKKASWGQEPGAGPHHIGLLNGKRLFTPKMDSIAADFERAKQIAPFAWIPHPAGWYPFTWYTDEMIDTLWTLGDSFAIEVINGAHKIFHAFDQYDQAAVKIWDRLLCDGKKITALGGGDAHVPETLGSTWTGVFADRCTASSLIESLNAGRCFASESTLIDLRCGQRGMGETIRRKAGSTITLKTTIADAGGLASVRVVSGGKVVKQYNAKGETTLKLELARKVGKKPTYYRVESTAFDDRRAFSTPIYVEPIQ